MVDLGLIVGHCLGDYILQTDWQAKNKTLFGQSWKEFADRWDKIDSVQQDDIKYPTGTSVWHNARYADWVNQLSTTRTGHFACTIHCLLYTLAIWVCSFWWMPWWGLLVCFTIHWFLDRFRLAARWMRNVSNQSIFASAQPVGMAPWSIVVVDNTFHLLTLFVIEAIAIAKF